MQLFSFLNSYVKNAIYPDQYDRFLRYNGLKLIHDDFFHVHNPVAYFMNKISVMKKKKMMIEITKLLNNHNIRVVHFKGVTLSELVYDDPYLRPSGDIDFVIEKEDYDQALQVLLENKYIIYLPYDDHHITLTKSNIIVEMHTCLFHPNDGIDFNITDKSLRVVNINDYNFFTLNDTTLLIYLLIHYYTHLKKGKKRTDYYYFFQGYQNSDAMPLSKLFDIALLVYKYSENIDWNYCASFICQAEFSIEFKMMILDFNYIFKDLLPKGFVHELLNKQYELTDEYYVYNYIYNNYMLLNKPKKIDDIVSEIVNQNNMNQIHITCSREKPAELRFQLDEFADRVINPKGSYLQSGVPPIDSEDLSGAFDLWIDNDELVFSFEIKSENLCFVPKGSLETDPFMIHCGDCIGINIVPQKDRYKFSYIYTLLERDEMGHTLLAVYDNAVNITNLVKPILQITDQGYRCSLFLPMTYIGVSNRPNNMFLLDVSLSNCDTKSIRKTTLSLSASEEAWYDPREYAVVNIE